METNLNRIHIFKTNIKQINPDCDMHRTLDNHSDIQQWSIDHEDVDCVLRVVSDVLKPDAIIEMINEFGHECQELS
ncbi:hypothetical protein [Flavobacterium sp. JAS]|uniref:hypothetical protein n=1 Tax=Flavobacterium sp. JAS TaxID=2897329 RepID=UPI001E39F490|nr:hypothetical protein [Flavobacterium sp. JAS]MCD0471451.1 hypothetical protein [Flavobacterium sp. JAS]